LLSAVALLASACAGDPVVMLRNSRKEGASLYGVRLARNYLQYAEDLRRKGDRPAAGRMARKGLAALEGTDAPPSPPPPNAGADLAQGHAFLSHLLRTPNVRERYPEQAAALLWLYDCRLIEETRLLPSDGKFACREPFLQKLDETFALASSARSEARGDDAAFPPPDGEGAPALWVRFDGGRVAVPEKGKAALRALAARLLAKGRPYRITLNGYSDPAKAREEAMRLSLERAVAVKLFLKAAGLDSRFIDAFAFGDKWTPEPGRHSGDPAARRVVEAIVSQD
jgi:outer membrane protein OmpA-like peptidoglycan-associated protein